MVRNFLLVIVALLLSAAVNAQTWVGFGGQAAGTPPEINVLQSDNQQVKFTVSLSGMYVETKNEASGVYKRVSMPECGVTGAVGSPEIPVVTKMVAIPMCSGIQYSATLSGYQTFNGYNVYPVPAEQSFADETDAAYVVEVFTKNAAVYALNQYMPAQNYIVADTGFLRAQRFVKLELHPIKYNPVTQTLSVATEMEITLTFTGATTPINSNVGIFNNVASKTMVNFADQGIRAVVNDKAFEKEGFTRGDPKYKRITKPQDVHNIQADYLIICANVFFPDTVPHAEVLRLAQHRIDYNGFDVVILNALDIISDATGFYYEGSPDPEFKKEQRIRTCIRTLYEKGSATKTLDGKLGYVLLIGKTDSMTIGMPTSFDHPQLKVIQDHEEGKYIFNDNGSDYYFSCITRDASGVYDKYGDLYIGRFCVPDNLNTDENGGLRRLHNMVEKTIKYETELTDYPPFKRRLNIAYGGELSGGTSEFTKWWNEVCSYVQSPNNVSGVNAFEYNQNAETFGKEIYNLLNSTNIGVLFDIYAHGGVNHWWSKGDGLLWQGTTIKNKLKNSHRQPFCMSSSCLTGRFHDYRIRGNVSYKRCLAEFMTSYSDTLGFIGMLASPTSKVTSLHRYISAAIFRDLSFIVGEFVLETHALNNYDIPFFFNLFGDPALNIMAEGYVVSKRTELKDLFTNISCKIKIIIEGELVIPANGTLWLDTFGNITVEQGGKLTLSNNSKITTFPQLDPDKFIKLNKGTISAPTTDTAKIENVYFQTTYTPSVSNIHFNNVNFTRKYANNYFADTSEYTISNCHFTDCTFKLENYIKSATVKNSSFTDTELTLKSDYFPDIKTMKLSNTQFTGSNIWHTNLLSNHNFDATGCTFTDCIVSLNIEDSEASITNSSFTNSILNSTSSLSNTPELIEINNTQFINSRINPSQHKIKAMNCAFKNRSDISTSFCIVDINKCAFQKSAFKAGLLSVLVPVEPFTPSIKIANSSFRNTGKYFIGMDLANGDSIFSTASITLHEIKEFEIVGDTIINTNAGKGNDPGGGLQNAPYGEGIYLGGAGKGAANKNLISGNEILWCETGLKLYNSKAQILGNEIYNNTYGARLFNNSQSTFMGSDGVGAYTYGYQIIRDNTSYDVYATNNAFPSSFKYNQVLKGVNPNKDPRIYYDVTRGGDPGGLGLVMNLTCNYWGSNFVHNDDIYPPRLFATAPTWSPQGPPCTSKGKGLFDDGMEYFENENYIAAKTAFIELISTYPDDPFSIAALHERFSLEQFLDNDYAALRDYYASFTPTDSALFDVADFLATRCNVVLQNWQPAVDWYEGRIEEPPSYQDSVFAVIDLGDIHLMMEDDSLKAARVFRFPNIKPKSRQQYEENKSALLATLPKIDQPRPQHPLAESGKKGVLSQNIPNPAKESTTIVYDVIEEGSVHLRIYNQLGQLLQDLPQGTQKPGSYRLEVSLVGMPAGVYHYVLFIEGEKADGKKLVVN